MTRRLILFLISFAVLHNIPLTAMQPPSEGMIERMKAQGTYEASQCFAKEIANNKPGKEFIDRFKYRLSQAKATAGSEPSLMAVPPAWDQGFPATGSPNVLVLLIDFPDAQRKFTKTTIEKTIFGSGPGDVDFYPRESLTNYYKRASNNRLNIQGDVLDWYRHNENRRTGAAATTAYRESLIEAAITYHKNRGVNFAKYDNNNDGVIDYIAVIWAGSHTGWSTFWWGYSTSISSSNSYIVDGKKLGHYTWQWEYASDQGDRSSSYYDPKTIIHETGHVLGLPDFYDYDSGVGPHGGVAGFDMMDGNNYDMNSFSKWILGWITPTIISAQNTPSTLTLQPYSTSYQSVLLMPSFTGSSQYEEFYLAENRQQTGNDSDLFSRGASGIVVWHVLAYLGLSDYSITNEYDYYNDNSYTEFKLLKLVEPDAANNIDRGWVTNISNSQFFNAGKEIRTAVSGKTASGRYVGAPTGIEMYNISKSGTNMTATFLLNQPPAKVGVFSANPNATSQTSVDLHWQDVGANGLDGTVTRYLIMEVEGTINGDSFEENNFGSVWTTASEGAGTWSRVTSGCRNNSLGCAKSGTLTRTTEGSQSSYSYLRKTISGPLNISFYWKVSSEAGYDHLSFLVDGKPITAISGNKNWALVNHSIGEGEHVIEWKFKNDQYVVEGSNAGWVDDITFSTPQLKSATAIRTVSSTAPAKGPAGTANSFTVNGLTAGQTYNYTIRAYNATGNFSDVSQMVSATAGAIALPPSVSTITAQANAFENSVTLNWNAPGSSGETGNITGGKYRISYSTYPAAQWNYENYNIEIDTDTAAGEPQTYNVDNLYGGITYYFVLWTQNAYGSWSEISNAASATPLNLAPLAPVNLTAVNSAAKENTLTWENASAVAIDLKNYTVQYSTSPSFAPFYEVNNVNLLTYVHSGLSSYTTYYYKVAANDFGGLRGGFSNMAYAFVPDGDAPVINSFASSTHQNNPAGFDTADLITMNWTASDQGSGLEGFYILYSRYSDVTPGYIIANGTFVADNILTYGETVVSGVWNIFLMAKDKAGNFSAIASYIAKVDAGGPKARISASVMKPGSNKISLTVEDGVALNGTPVLHYILPQTGGAAAEVGLNAVVTAPVNKYERVHLNYTPSGSWEGYITIKTSDKSGTGQFLFNATDTYGKEGTIILSGGTFEVDVSISASEGGIVTDSDGTYAEAPAGAHTSDFYIVISTVASNHQGVADANNALGINDPSHITGQDLVREFLAFDKATNMPITTFAKDIKIGIPFDPAFAGANVKPGTLKVFYLKEPENVWQRVQNTSADLSNNIVWAYTKHFSVYAILADITLTVNFDAVKVYPNPCYMNKTAQVTFEKLPNINDVSVQIYTVNGQLVRKLEDGNGIVQAGGSKTGYWDGRNVSGSKVASGLYFYLIKAGSSTKKGKVAILW